SLLLLHRHAVRSHLPSFPTRRSSDLTVHTGCDLTGRAFMRFYQPQTGQVWQVQRAFTTVVRFAFCTGFRDVTQGIGTHVTKSFRSEEHTSELQSRENLVCRLLLEKKK